MGSESFVHIEVAYATSEKQMIIPMKVPKGTTVLQAIDFSLIYQHFPEIIPEDMTVGVFGHKISDPAHHIVQDKDRIEIYRPLIANPMEIRRRRAEKLAKKKLT